MKELTYLIYIIFWESFCFGGCAYIVFHLGHSGGWFILAFFLGCSAYRPETWIHGKKPYLPDGDK